MKKRVFINVSVKSFWSKFAIMAVVIVAMIALNHNAFARTKTVKSSYAETFVTANFSYDGASPTLLGTHAGDDNIGGQFTGQLLSEYSLTTNPCTALDSSAGVAFLSYSRL